MLFQEEIDCSQTDLSPDSPNRQPGLSLISLPNSSILPLRIIAYRHLVGLCMVANISVHEFLQRTSLSHTAKWHIYIY